MLVRLELLILVCVEIENELASLNSQVRSGDYPFPIWLPSTDDLVMSKLFQVQLFYKMVNQQGDLILDQVH